MIKLIKKEQAIARKITDKYTTFNMITKEFSKKVSVAISEGINHLETTKNVKSDRIYYILEGQLIVTQNNKKYIVNPGDIIFIEKNTPYNFRGTFKSVLINVPAFDPKNEKTIEI